MDTVCVAYALEPEHEELFRHMIHDEVDKWVDELLVVFDKDRQPSLMELSELLNKTRHEFLGPFLQRLIEQKYSYLLEQEYCRCSNTANHLKTSVTAQSRLLPCKVIVNWIGIGIADTPKSVL